MKPVNHKPEIYPEDKEESNSHVMYNESFLLNSPQVKAEIDTLKKVIDQRNAMILERNQVVSNLTNELDELKNKYTIQTEHFEQVREEESYLID
jgi:hypothetical protein